MNSLSIHDFCVLFFWHIKIREKVETPGIKKLHAICYDIIFEVWKVMITPQYKCHRAAYHSSKIRAFLTNVWLKFGCCLQLELSHVTEWQIGGIEGVFRVPSTF